ncbi:MAG: hypothetical protein C4539_07020 [Ignavibacteriales bacterium]|nr:MAG: hypothetical protein C4539_07020 [Ignavibacteriales bacterium]
MKTKLLVFALLLTVMVTAQTQHKRMNHMQKVKNKIEELEKIKLIEILDLNDEAMIKFLNRRKDFIERNSQLEEKKNKQIDNLRESIDNLDEQKGKVMIDEILATDEEIVKNRREFVYSLKDLLNNKQIAKFIIFERNFKKELKELLLKKRTN